MPTIGELHDLSCAGHERQQGLHGRCVKFRNVAQVRGGWDPRPMNRQFLSEQIDFMHRSIVRQRWIFSAFAVLAVSLAIVGLLGLASSAAEERRLEIGVRNAFGAGNLAIVRLILWRSMKVAAFAGVIGCLLALPLMRRWLERFQDRIDLEPWMFVGACALMVSVAIVTVLGHSLLMARARPIAALRNE